MRTDWQAISSEISGEREGKLAGPILTERGTYQKDTPVIVRPMLGNPFRFEIICAFSKALVTTAHQKDLCLLVN